MDKLEIKGGRVLRGELRISGAKNQHHTTIKGGGHFLQEDCGKEFAKMVVNFISQTS